jgi:cell division protein FtsL
MINKTRSTKIKFCKNCGKERILSNYKCTSCGKISGMYILKIFAIVLLLILLGISVFFNIYQYNISIEKTIYYEKKIKQNEHQINALFDRENSEAAETKELLSEIYEGTVKIYKNPNGELQLQWPNNSQVRIYK